MTDQTLTEVILSSLTMLLIWFALCAFAVLALWVAGGIREHRDRQRAAHLEQLAADREEADELTALADSTGVLVDRADSPIPHTLTDLERYASLDQVDEVVAQWAAAEGGR